MNIPAQIGAALLSVSLVYAGIMYRSSPLVEQERVARSGYVMSTTFESRNDNDLYWEAQRLLAIAQGELGITVKFGTLASAQGLNFGAQRVIIIDETLQWSGRFEVLAHEIAHQLSPYLSGKEEGEVFAEAVAVLVAADVGDVSMAARSGRYLRQHRGVLHVLQDYSKDIHRVANFLSRR